MGGSEQPARLTVLPLAAWQAEGPPSAPAAAWRVAPGRRPPSLGPCLSSPVTTAPPRRLAAGAAFLGPPRPTVTAAVEATRVYPLSGSAPSPSPASRGARLPWLGAPSSLRFRDRVPSSASHVPASLREGRSPVVPSGPGEPAAVSRLLSNLLHPWSLWPCEVAPPPPPPPPGSGGRAVRAFEAPLFCSPLSTFWPQGFPCASSAQSTLTPFSGPQKRPSFQRELRAATSLSEPLDRVCAGRGAAVLLPGSLHGCAHPLLPVVAAGGLRP